MKHEKIKKNTILGTAGGLMFFLFGLIFLFSQPAMAPEIQHKVLGTTDEAKGGVFSVDQQRISDSLNVSAKSLIVFDTVTGEVFASRATDSTLPIASLTKLMTGYLIVKHGFLADTLTVPADGVIDVKPKLSLTPGEQVRVADLLNSMIVGSANDAALTLGKYLETKLQQPIGELMSAEAKSLGMKNTQFSNPMGFDSDRNYSTADDMKLLVQSAYGMDTFRALGRFQSYSFESLSGKPYQIKSTNKLISSHSDIEAIKTGYTDEARGAMITAFKSGERRIAIIVLGSSDREQDTLAIKSAVEKALTP